MTAFRTHRGPDGGAAVRPADGDPAGGDFCGAAPLREAKKEFLSGYRLLDAEIRRLVEERDEWFARATRVTAGCGPASGRAPGGGDRLGDYVARLTELDALIDGRIDELVALRLKIEGLIEGLGDPLLRNLLALRYINGLTFEQMEERLYYSSRQLMNLHVKALDRLPQAAFGAAGDGERKTG